ncbi:MAG TPA: hypothetical protein VNO43_05690 [Candidatus Eisenbacteria bacterium]|nr:hypothetical protein [Candidatus Eisenbacteria bacterium]
MESSNNWLFILAGGITTCLGLLLFAAERELKKQRRRVEELLCLQAEAAPVSAPSSELIAEKRQLQENVSLLSSRLAESERIIAAREQDLSRLQGEQQKLLANQSHVERLREETRSLQQKLADAQAELIESQSSLSESRFQIGDMAEERLQLRSTIAELEERVERLTLEIQERDERLRTLSIRLGAGEPAAEELRRLRERIKQLEFEKQQSNEAIEPLRDQLRNAQEQLRASEARLAESAAYVRAVAERNSKLESEILAAREGSDERLEAAQTRLHHALGELEKQHGLCAELKALNAALARQVESLQANDRARCEAERKLAEFASCQARLERENAELRRQALAVEKPEGPMSEAQRHERQPLGPDSAAEVQGRLRAGRTRFGWRARTWQLGLASALTVLFVAAGLVATSPDGFSLFEGDPIPQTELDPSSNGMQGSGGDRRPASGVNDREGSPNPRVQGVFKITRPTQIYSAPSERSALIAEADPGVKINVVGARNGWLEVRSKHGRPPGFVRQEAAARIE